MILATFVESLCAPLQCCRSEVGKTVACAAGLWYYCSSTVGKTVVCVAGLWYYYSSTVGKIVACAAGLWYYYSSTEDVIIFHFVRYYSGNRLPYCTVYCRTATVCWAHSVHIDSSNSHTLETKRHGCLVQVVSHGPLQWLQNGSTVTSHIGITYEVTLRYNAADPNMIIDCCGNTNLLNLKVKLHQPAQSEGDVTPTCSIWRRGYTNLLNLMVTLQQPAQSEDDIKPTCSIGKWSYTYNIILNAPNCFVSLCLHFNCLHTKPGTLTLQLIDEIWYWEN